MNSRTGLALLAGFLFMASGCGPGMNAEGGLSPDMDPEDLPSWAQDLEEGIPPTENQYTQDASIHLVEAELSDDEEARREAYEAALEYALDGIEAEPENALSYFQAGEAYLGLGMYEEADEHFTRAEELHPQIRLETEFIREQAWADLYNEAAEFMEAGDNERALETFEQAHTLYRHRPEAMLNLASLHHSVRGDTERAAEFYEEAIDVMLGPRMDDIEDEEQRAAWEENLEVALFNHAQLNFEMERYEEAARNYQRILDRDPENLMAMSNLAVAYMQAGETERATRLYDELLDRPDLTAQEYFMIGVGFFQADEFEQASRAFRETLNMVPNHRDALLNLTQTLYFGEDWEQLAEVGDELVELDPYNQLGYQFVAQAYVQMEDEQTAVGYLDRMEELPFEFTDIQLQPGPEGGAIILGQIQNFDMTPGTPVEVEFVFLGDDGSEVGSEVVQIDAPGEDELANFQVQHAAQAQVAGYYYNVRSP